MRASDAERDDAVGALRERFAEGRISQDTFLYRMDAALRAKDRWELAGLLHDLPEGNRQAGAARPAPRSALTRWRLAITSGLAAVRSSRPRKAGHAPAMGAALPEPPPLCLPPHSDGRFTIGRALACDFTLADLSVSRWHAKLHRDDEHWMLSDLGSTNGTRLNGWRVTTGVPVRPGDRVSFGSVTFVITERPAEGLRVGP